MFRTVVGGPLVPAGHLLTVAGGGGETGAAGEAERGERSDRVSPSSFQSNIFGDQYEFDDSAAGADGDDDHGHTLGGTVVAAEEEEESV